MYDAIVVGGGLAGLSAAWRLRNLDVLLLEREERFGGRLRSERRGPYWLNWGGHVFNGTENSATSRLLESVGVDAAPVPGNLTGLAMNGRTLTRGRVETNVFKVPMPFSSRLATLRAGAKVRLAVAEYARISAPRRGEHSRVRQQRIYDYRASSSFADFLGDLPEDALALFKPTVTRSAGELHEVSAGAGIGYFHLVWDRSGGLGYNIVGGPTTLTETIASGLRPNSVKGAEVKQVILHKDSVEVSYEDSDGTEHNVTARHVVMATPAPVTRQLIDNVDDNLAEALGQIKYGPYVAAAFLTNEIGPAPWDDSYAIATPKRSFNVAFNMSSLIRGSELEREPGSSIMVFSPGDLARKLIDMDDTAILDTYLSDLARIFPSLPDSVTEAEVQRWPLGLAYNFPHRGTLQGALTRPYGRLHLAGDYLGSLYTETSVQTGFDAAQDILSAVGSAAFN